MQEKIQKAVEIMNEGGTLLYPTDTIWGLGCDATNEAACQKILEIKKRPANKSFVLLADSFRMVEHYIPEFAEVVYDLVDYAEKPLTIIYPGATKLAPSVIAEDGSVGIRITKDPICLALIRKMRRPLVSTSANISGEPFPTNFSEVHSELKSGVDFIIDERLKEKMTAPSQIIKVGLGGEVKIIRS
ncbi:MAG: L-threonylcarbamoyladenylate synthase [Crocinitomicaceae bacterium]|jgi:L-threonylcarbamoyladenylate synthase|nr:L-threonylcarbamoyladenylate synthase [Crocinitomicaceae bacterium]